MVNRKIMQIDEEFSTLLKEIKRERLKFGTDSDPISERRLSKAVARQIRNNLNDYMTLIKAKLEDDTKYINRRNKR